MSARFVDAEHVAEQERGRLRRPGGVEMQEQKSQAQRQRQHHADRDVALGELLAEKSHADSAQEGEADKAGQRREAEQHRARRPGEADMRQRMAGEGLSAQHEEEADRSGEDRRHARRGEGGAHEIVFKHAASS